MQCNMELLLSYVTHFLAAFCKIGFVSPTGLEDCYACEKGQYQNVTGQTECLACGDNMTTPGDGATRRSDCAGINQKKSFISNSNRPLAGLSQF